MVEPSIAGSKLLDVQIPTDFAPVNAKSTSKEFAHNYVNTHKSFEKSSSKSSSKGLKSKQVYALQVANFSVTRPF